MVSQPGCDADSPASGNQGVRLLVLSTFSVLTKNVLRFLDRGMINVQQGGLSKTAKIKSRSMSHTVEIEFLDRVGRLFKEKKYR